MGRGGRKQEGQGEEEEALGGRKERPSQRRWRKKGLDTTGSLGNVAEGSEDALEVQGVNQKPWGHSGRGGERLMESWVSQLACHSSS